MLKLKNVILPSLLALGASILPSHATAVDLGVNVGLGTGTAEYTFSSGWGGDIEQELDVDYTQLGFSLDTGIDGSWFQYRLHAGLHMLGDGFFDSSQLGLGVDNHLRFVANANAPVRFWAGPSIYLGVMGGDFESGVYAGAGPTIGLDIDLGDGPTLGLELSSRVAVHTHFFDSEDVDSEDIFLRATLLF